jgi:hypothetical protein
MNKFNLPTWIKTGVVSIALTLTACGGGGGGGGAPPPTGPVASTLSFPVQSALATESANGATYSLTANGTGAVAADGDCTGNYTETTGPANTPANFEGVAGFSSTTVMQMNFTNCVPAAIAETVTNYFDSTYAPLGFQALGGDYGVWAAPPVIPASVKVGDAAIVGTIDNYTDNTKTTANGRQDMSYVVEPDTANTAIINLVFKVYNAASQLLATEQDRYRITSTGALTLISVDVQFATTSTIHLVFR